MEERLQNILAARGAASRRGAAALIEEGRVTVNGNTVMEPGKRFDPAKVEIRIDGRALQREAERCRTFMFHKPAGFVCSVSGEQGESVCTFFREFSERLVPVGRLDKESEGLLLMSNDGAFIERMTHPRYGHQKLYEVEVAGHMTPEKMATLRSPLEIDGYTIRPVEVDVIREGANHVHRLAFTLGEGRNRQIRKMCAIAGFTVLRLRRTRIDFLTLGTLKPGEFRELTPAEIKRLT